MHAKLNIIISLGFAAIMIGAGLLIDNQEHAQFVLLMLIALWFIPFTYLSRAKKQKPDA
ncbi:MAG TPA: hypothetical protein P5121_33060 [Caldilineaceae bacterium]|nr:hypothetical protein [Caldilineaceae bacterium]